MTSPGLNYLTIGHGVARAELWWLAGGRIQRVCPIGRITHKHLAPDGTIKGRADPATRRVSLYASAGTSRLLVNAVVELLRQSYPNHEIVQDS